MEKKMKVYLVGHPISPIRGSEPGNTWNWAWELSKYIDVTVLAHPHYRYEVESYLKENPNPRLKIYWIDLNTTLDPWKWKTGSEKGIRLHYILWLFKVKMFLQELLKQHSQRSDILIHHVSWGSVHFPPPFWNFKIPIIWGPVGGGQVAPKSFKKYFGSKWRKEVLRSLSVKMLPYNPLWRLAVKSYSLILATNHETRLLIEKSGRQNVHLFLDCGIPQKFGLPFPPAPKAKHKNKIIFLWAGRFEPIKALPIALEAISRVKGSFHLLIAGDGELRKEYEHIVKILKLEKKVTFLGRIPYNEMPQVFKKADVFLFTSLRDSVGSVVFEAMSYGLPVIIPDHQGVGAFVPSSAGIKVPIVNPEITVEYFAKAIDKILSDHSLRFSLSKGAWEFAQTEKWDKRAERMLRLYEDILRDFRK